MLCIHVGDLTPLMIACMNNKYEVVTLLMEKGASLQAVVSPAAIKPVAAVSEKHYDAFLVRQDENVVVNCLDLCVLYGHR